MATINIGDTGENHRLSLAGELNIYSVAALWQKLLQTLKCNTSLEIDLSGITDFDTSGVQLLLVLKREATRQQKPLSFVQHSLAVCEVLALLNLVDEIGNAMVIPLALEESHS